MTGAGNPNIRPAFKFFEKPGDSELPGMYSFHRHNLRFPIFL